MVYRQPADEIARRDDAVHGGPLAHVGVDGRPGRPGGDGATGRGGSGTGRNGERGGDAGGAERGEGGGVIDLAIATLPGRPGIVSVKGVGVDEEIDFSRAGDIRLDARGGRGGSGGNGGRGGNGARGSSGANATGSTYGGDGGSGGNGGDAGAGSSGADGGRGGAITVRVAKEDTHLLMLVDADASGGPGGKPGQNGTPGRGGEGGFGGSSYSWTTTMTTSDGQGNTTTIPTTHTNRGGSHGPAGRSGRASNVFPQPGRPGAAGAFAIDVGGARYPSRYDVQLVSFRHRNANDDGIYEPEEQVFVDRLEIANIGGMPTPAHHEVRVGLQDLGWVAPGEATLRLPRRLAPGQRCVLDEQLTLTLRVYRPQASGAPLSANETIRFFADLPDVARRFTSFETSASALQGKLVVRFPVEASPLTSLFSLAPGQAARVRWSITNVSGKPYGLESAEKRAVSVFFGLASGNTLDATHLHFLDDDGDRVPLDTGFRRALPIIAPHETITFEGTLAVAEDAQTYASARLFLAAELGHIADPQHVRPIQYQEVTLRVGRPFDARDADVLFVANNRTTQEELAAWEALATRTGMSSAVWDASLEGGVGILEDVAAGSRRFSLVVFLNNTMDMPSGEHRASVLLDKSTSLALARRDVHVLYVGRAPDLDDLVLPTDADPALTIADIEVIGDGGTIAVRQTYAWPWSSPTPRHLTRRAEALSAALEKRWPERRYVVVPRWALALEKQVAWVKTYRLGDLVVRRTLDAAHRAITSFVAEAKDMHTAGFAAGLGDHVLAALPFEAKLARTTLAADAIVEDLVREQAQVARYGWRLPREKLTSALPFLAALTACLAPSEQVIEIAARLELVARDRVRFWEWLPPLVWLRRAPSLRAFIRGALRRWLFANGVSEAAVKARRKQLSRERKEPPPLASDVDFLPAGARVIDAAHIDALREKERGRTERAAAIVAGAGAAKRELLRTETCAELLARATPTRVATAPIEEEEETRASAEDLRDLLRR